MITLNLLPDDLKKKQAAFTAIELSSINVKNIPLVGIAGAVIGAVIVVHMALLAINLYAQTQRHSLERRTRSIAAQWKEAEALKRQVETINKKAAAIDGLMVKRFSWSNKLNELNDAMTPGIWLTALSYDERLVERQAGAGSATNNKNNAKSTALKPATERALSRQLILSGYTASPGEEGAALVGKFIKSLKENPGFFADFNDIELGAIKSEKFQEQEVMSFTVTCLFKDLPREGTK